MSNPFWQGFWALPLGIVTLAAALAILVITWWIASEKFLDDRFWREQRPIVGRKMGKARTFAVDQATLHLLSRWAWGVQIAPGVRIALYVSGDKPTDAQWNAAKDAMDRIRSADEIEDEG